MLSHETLLDAVPLALGAVDLDGYGPKTAGKVRDIYRRQGTRILITTDRISAFDRVLGTIPHKGQVLNQLSAWWFAQVEDIVPTHVLAVPDPNVTIAREATPLPIEVVVRGYITGVTKTSLWSLYENGDRQPYGVSLPDGLHKNAPLPAPIITPTTKAADGGHDERITPAEIVRRGIVSASLYELIARTALALFARGKALAARAGLILVDTKYEFGLHAGRLILIDELHTPDSSRYWIADSYGDGRSPEHLDKEFLRTWYAQQGYRGSGTPPRMPPNFLAQVAARYIDVFERVTGTTFAPGDRPVGPRIQTAVDNAFRQIDLPALTQGEAHE